MKKFLPFQSLVALSTTACLFAQVTLAQPPSDPPAFRPDFSVPGSPALMESAKFGSANKNRTTRPDMTGKGPNSYLPPRVKTRVAPSTSGTSGGSSLMPLAVMGLAVVAAGAVFVFAKKPEKPAKSA